MNRINYGFNLCCLRSQNTIHRVSAEADDGERSHRPQNRPDPAETDDTGHLAERQLRTGESLDDHVVAIVRNERQRENLIVAEHRACPSTNQSISILHHSFAF